MTIYSNFGLWVGRNQLKLDIGETLSLLTEPGFVILAPVKFTITSIGKVKQQFILDGEEEYLKRLPREIKIKLQELGAESTAAANEAEIKSKESKKILESVGDREFVIALDERGKQFSSQDFAALLESESTRGNSSFTFLIGGAYGFDDAVRKRANLVLSLSKFTFTYQMTRLLLVEQLYRAVTIIKRLPYHKAG